jgi:hypothetical protein
MRHIRNIIRHQYVNIAMKKNHQKRKMNVGNWRQTKLLVQIIGNPIKAPEGARGSQ